MQYIDLILSMLVGGTLGFFLGRVSSIERYKQHLQEEMLVLWVQARKQTLQKIIKMVDNGINQNRWPNMAHFRRDLVEITRILDNEGNK